VSAIDKRKIRPGTVAQLQKACDKYGLVNIKVLAQVLDEPLEQLAGITPISAASLRRNPKAPRAQASARRLLALVRRIRDNTGSLRHTVLWLHAPHGELENKSPLDVIKAGYIDVIEDLVHMYEVGQPG
jgi:uncharacterized protein (DUF2384 family)